ncbi:MAG: aromatic amino acid hydroxylase, partial [Pseudobdellovibrionaceae bacterium]
EIKAAEEKLDHVSNGMSHISEATLLGRMNWWTAEYGLIGDLKSPKILGAGILSSVGEAKNCLSDRVKKLPLTVDCVDYSYDITEQQPQLFVTPDFAHLSVVLEQLAERMAFRIGGSEGLNRAIQAKSINTVQFDSGLQISGVLAETIEANGGLAYLRFQGRSQLCFSDQQLQGHGPDYHSQGYSTPVGNLKNFKNVCPSELSDSQWKELGLTIGADAEIEFTSGVKVKGRLTSKLQKNGKTLLLSFENCLVKYQDRVLFEPSWGTFDMALGCTIPSVFGGPADRIAFGETDDFVAARVPQRKWTDKEILLHSLYQRIRDQREKKIKGADLSSTLKEVSAVLDTEFPAEWLLKMEIYELCDLASEPVLKENTLNFLYDLKTKTPELASTIDDGLRLAKHL